MVKEIISNAIQHFLFSVLISVDVVGLISNDNFYIRHFCVFI
jgi:hypothetical protein